MSTVQSGGTTQRLEVASYEKLMRNMRDAQTPVQSIGNRGRSEVLSKEAERLKFDVNSLSEEAKEKLEAELKKLNDSIASSGKLLKFKYDEDAEATYVEVIDAASQEVVVSLPPQFLIELTVKMKELIGMFIDEKY